MLLNINKALHEAGISIPYPIQTLHVSQEEVEEEKIVMESGGESTPESSQQQLEPAPVIVEPPATPKPISTEDVNAQTWLKKSEPQPEPAPVEQPQQVPSPEVAPQPEQKPIAGITPVQPPPAEPTPEQQPPNPDQQGQ
ncbi:MAG: hypothetical protein R3B71_00410 [Candidatus Gracilibacteria bacterium]